MIECEIGSAYKSDCNTLFLRIKLNTRKRQTIWRVNVGMLNNEGLLNDLKEDIRGICGGK